MFNKARLNKKKEKNKKIASERIVYLFNFINELYADDFYSDMTKDRKQELANRYVKLARTIAMKYNISIPKDLKKKFCKHCHNHFIIGENVKVRVNNGKIIYSCFNCKKHYRIPLLEKK